MSQPIIIIITNIVIAVTTNVNLLSTGVCWAEVSDAIGLTVTGSLPRFAKVKIN